MKAVDLFCGYGGASEGLERAGMQVIRGVDLVKRKEYRWNYVEDDAWFHDVSDADFVWASPPCTLWSVADGTPRERIRMKWKFEKPYIVENVAGGLEDAQLMLCGTMFGSGYHKHRYFSSNINLGLSPHSCQRTFAPDMRFWSMKKRMKLPPEYSEYLARMVREQVG